MANEAEQKKPGETGGALPPEPQTVVLKPGETVVSQKILETVMAQAAAAEKTAADAVARAEGIEAMFQESKEPDTTGEKKLRERKNFEPAFRTVRIRKYPMGGDFEKQGFVIGWTNRGAYQRVDKSGISAQVVDFIDLIFLDHEKNEKGELVAEAVPLLDLLNRGEQIHCKVIEKKLTPRKEPTGEVIRINEFDPKHGLIQTGEEIDGWVGFTDISYKIQIPGRTEPVEIDGKYVNA